MKIILTLFLGCLLSGSVLGDRLSPKEIICKAQNSNMKITYAIGENQQVNETRWISKTGDKFIRQEIIENGRVKFLTITNPEGVFELFPASKIAILNLLLPKEVDFRDVAQYSMREITYNECPCWEIIEKIPLNDRTFEVFEKSRQHMLGYNRSIMRDFFFKQFTAFNIYIVSKKDGVIIQQKSFSSRGKLNSKIDFTNCEFIQKINSQEFVIPDDYKVFRPTTVQECSDMYQSIIKQTVIAERPIKRKEAIKRENKARRQAKIKSIAFEVERIFFKYSSVCCIIIAVLSGGLVLLYKLRKK